MAGARRPSPVPAARMVIGVGNANRGDDAVGLVVAQLLRARLGRTCAVVEQTGEGTELLDLWEHQDRVWAVDAIRAGGAPGTLYRVPVGVEGLASPLATTSSHALSLGQAVALGQALGRMPRVLVIHGVEPARTDVGAGLSPLVRAAADALVPRIESEVRESMRGPPHA